MIVTAYSSFSALGQTVEPEPKVESDPDYFTFFKRYIDPAMYIAIIIFGLVMNGTLLIIFLKHREVRTAANIMILNLAICDVLNICINAPLHYFFHYDQKSPEDMTSCRVYTAGRQFFRSVSAVSLTALSLQRFCVTVPRFQGNQYSKLVIAVYVAAVWTLPLAVALPPSFVWENYAHICSTYWDPQSARITILSHAIFYCVLLPALVISLNIVTARRLRRSAEDVPGEAQDQVKSRRNRSATVVTLLAVLYVASHLPYWVWCLVVYWAEVDRHGGVVLFTEYVTKYLLFTDACFNPVALYIASGTFRKLFSKYLYCSLCLRREHGDETSTTPLR